MTTFNRYVNDPTTSETELHKRSGDEVTVIRRLTEADQVDPEVGAMYRIRFADGFEADAFGEELDIEGEV